MKATTFGAERTLQVIELAMISDELLYVRGFPLIAQMSGFCYANLSKLGGSLYIS